jgi:sterol desaturase/sphingolipid hydroxylase (fatty acid hydroxylase superfamily)
MSLPSFQTVLAGYNWQLSLAVIVLVAIISRLGLMVFRLVPDQAESERLNVEAAEQRKRRDSHGEILRRSYFYVYLTMFVNFALIVPFTVTLETQSWWKYPLDAFIILMTYDFFYYLVHRFLFHDNGILRGPLLQVHAVHHRIHNPCRADSAYLHPLEAVAGTALYSLTILLLAVLMGRFHVGVLAFTFIAFSAINQQNHNLWVAEPKRFKYLGYMSRMHHHHHAVFTGGNFATITTFYDWLFGSLDHGNGWGRFTGKGGVRKSAQS